MADPTVPVLPLLQTHGDSTSIAAGDTHALRIALDGDPDLVGQQTGAQSLDNAEKRRRREPGGRGHDQQALEIALPHQWSLHRGWPALESLSRRQMSVTSCRLPGRSSANCGEVLKKASASGAVSWAISRRISAETLPDSRMTCHLAS